MKSKEQKRIEAEERKAIYEGLSTVEKIEKLNEGGYRAIRQRARIEEHVDKDS